MTARDSNNATWYVLRYPEQYIASSPSDPATPFGEVPMPWLDPALLYDSARGVLELEPEPLDREVAPLPGIAVAIDGDVYAIEPRTGALIVKRCDGSEVPVVCEPGILARPSGLALDRRGFLYVADPPARRVVVLRPEDGTVRAILGGLDEPVDVAVGGDGMIYVADRAAGWIARYSPRWQPSGGFAPVNVAGLPPRPISVMLDDDGHVLVADASYPRILVYEPNGEALADLTLRSLTETLAGGDVAIDALHRAYGARVPRFIVGTCCAVGGDGSARLVAVARAVRLLRLSLGRRFHDRGTFISMPFDGGVPGTTWHRVELDADLPAGTTVTVETFTSDGTPLGGASAVTWSAPATALGAPVSFSTDVLDQLVQSPPGRFVWVRVTLASDGTATPTVRAIRVYYPRVSYAELLPAVFRRDPEAAEFLPKFLALFEYVFTGLEDAYAAFYGHLRPAAASPDVLAWLAALIDLSFDPSWPLERRRALVEEGIALYRIRGTVRGLRRYIEIYSGIEPVISEAFLERPNRPAFLGRPGSILGCGLPLMTAGPTLRPEDGLWRAYAHRFDVTVYADDGCDETVLSAVVDRIIEVNKPAHTAHKLRVMQPGVQVGISSTVGIDLVVGSSTPPVIQIGGGEDASAVSGVGALGVDTILGERPVGYLRPIERRLD
jgi:phage tail-like protein